LLFVAIPLSAGAQDRTGPLSVTPNCGSCAEWNTPTAPFTLHGNTHYVGTRGLSAVLVTSPEGHILIDGGLRESAPLIAASIRALGFKLEDVRVILNTHEHYDHAGGIARLQQASGARVLVSAPAAEMFRSGRPSKDDPQYEILGTSDPVQNVSVLADREVVRVGPLALTMHWTGGHAPGGTSWTWQSCDSAGCVQVVYADSQTPVSADGYRFTEGKAVAEFERAHARIESLACDLLVTPHPDASRLWQRVEARNNGGRSALIDREACRRYVASARQRLRERLELEKKR
jgi:metallo-beta-lactamase class B